MHRQCNGVVLLNQPCFEGKDFIEVWLASHTEWGAIAQRDLDFSSIEISDLERRGRRARASLISRLMLRHALWKKTGVSPANWKFYSDKDGRLCSKDNFLGLYPSISYCDDLIAVALSNKRIGLDLEKENIDPEVISVAFSEQENSILKQDKGASELAAKMWMRKEAYSKWIGLGVERDFKTISMEEILTKTKEYSASISHNSRDYLAMILVDKMILANTTLIVEWLQSEKLYR